MLIGHYYSKDNEKQFVLGSRAENGYPGTPGYSVRKTANLRMQECFWKIGQLVKIKLQNRWKVKKGCVDSRQFATVAILSMRSTTALVITPKNHVLHVYYLSHHAT